VDYVMKT